LKQRLKVFDCNVVFVESSGCGGEALKSAAGKSHRLELIRQYMKMWRGEAKSYVMKGTASGTLSEPAVFA
jgi:hypothetical protein